MGRMAELWQEELDKLDGQDYDDFLAYQQEQQRLQENDHAIHQSKRAAKDAGSQSEASGPV